ncbi:MAG TPA: efflux transporter outer membrane subunit [Noviherbaspirillum sp.]|nr:efflux transporter outer membrane subunit [Noviherbaspirillum sp.]
MNTLKQVTFACLSLLLSACATQTPPASIAPATPAQWHAPLPSSATADALPHNGTLPGLSQWWQQQGDPLLVQLIEAAQEVSPSIAAAAARIEQARSTRVAANAALLPTLDASLSASRTSAQPPLPINTVAQAALQTSWEIDLFGAGRASRDAAQARLEGAEAGWHDARVAVAAEVANQYYSLRACEKLLNITLADTTSRAEIARLSELSARAGFQAPATAALARASAAEGNARATQQRALCDIDIKALVALTAMSEQELRQQLAENRDAPDQSTSFSIASLPAQTLTQRPDVFAASREVAAASAEIGNAQAQRYPRLSLSGSVGAAKFRAAGLSDDLATWSVGPLALSLPLFDGGSRAANIEAAKARYNEAAARYRATVRQAVREVEEALVNLQSTGARREDVLLAAQDYRVSFNATQSRYKNGLASLVELEESRRTLLAAESVVVSLERERRAAWITLYRAAGGGWTGPSMDAVQAQH